MPAPRAALDHHRTQQQLAAKAVLAARHLWAKMHPADFDGSWQRVGPQLQAVLTVAQARAAVDSANYVPRVLAEQDIPDRPEGTVDPAKFAGVASSGVALSRVLLVPVIRAKQFVGQGANGADALAQAASLLDGIMLTQVADAGRSAAGTATAARPDVSGYIREIGGQGCDRCVELAGAFYRWSDGFDRHPQCGCVHVPTNRGATTGQPDASPPAFDTSAGIATASAQGRAARGSARDRVRVMPEQIYANAASRAGAIRLLHRFGYLT